MIDDKKLSAIECTKREPCFARRHSIFSSGPDVCGILTESYKNGKCPFCKPERQVTKGKFYPYSEALLDHHARARMKEVIADA